MEGLVYFSVRLGCAAYLLYKVWEQKGKIRELCDLLYTPAVKKEKEAATSPVSADGVDVMGKTRFVYLDENAGQTVAPYMSEPMEQGSSDYIGEEEEIREEDVECDLPLEEMELLRQEQEELDRAMPGAEAVTQVITPEEFSIVVDVLMKVNGADQDMEKRYSAARTLFAIRNTNLFDLFTSQVGNEEVVNQLLEEHLDEEGRPLLPKKLLFQKGKKEGDGVDWRELV